MFILFSSEYLLYTICGIVMLPAIIYALIVSSKVNSTFDKFSKLTNSGNYTGAQAARKILDSKGLYNIQVVRKESSSLVDNYNTQTNTVTLSSKVFDSTSIAAVGVAAHECGHAIQHAEAYRALKLRSAFGKVSSVASQVLWPIVFIGIICNLAYIGGVLGNIFLYAGIGFFGISTLFALITLPVEKNASKRALILLTEQGIVDRMEVEGSKCVLDAAAKTYVAAIVVSIMQLLRFILFFLMMSGDR